MSCSGIIEVMAMVVLHASILNSSSFSPFTLFILPPLSLSLRVFASEKELWIKYISRFELEVSERLFLYVVVVTVTSQPRWWRKVNGEHVFGWGYFVSCRQA